MADEFAELVLNLDPGRRQGPPTPPPARGSRDSEPSSYAEIWRRGGRHYIHSDDRSEPMDVDLSSEEEEDNAVVEVKKTVLEVRSIDLKELVNGFTHHTDLYDRVKNDSCLVIRRGQEFNFELTFDRPYDEAKDTVSLVFQTGKRPNVCDGSRVVLPLKPKKQNKFWSLKIEEVDGNTLNLSVTVPATSMIGKWYIKVNSVNSNKEQPILKEWRYSKPIYILFNPWCEDDDVYHPDQKFREDYVLEDEGRIYTGSILKDWLFGQFEDPVLDCVIRILEENGPHLRITSFSNPAQIVRKLTSVVNSNDNYGVLEGNWSGKYGDGTKPTFWKGSIKIIEQYFKTKRPVKYGQCWVFSGLLTTCCRAIGIPARSVTNYDSAHDTDCSLTIDKFYKQDGMPMPERNLDSIWNFHVWNDAWMARPDLHGEFSEAGFQACDATPQESSSGFMRCGPCPLKAIKEGIVNTPHDAPFIFSEVNGDVVNWIQDDSGEFIVHSLNRHRVGSVILAYNKRLGKDDITGEYKYGSLYKELEVVKRASQCMPETAHKKKVYGSIEDNPPEVSLELVNIHEVLYGDPYDVDIKVTNLVKDTRTVVVHMASTSVYYTGVYHKVVKDQTFNAVLQAGESKEFKMTVTCDEYERHICENCHFKISTACKVKESGHVYLQEDDFQLHKPVLTVKAEPKRVKVGEKVNINVSFTNSLPKDLTECVLSIEGVGLQRSREIPITRNVGSNEKFQMDLDIQPFKARKDGPRTLVVDFDSKEMIDVMGRCEIFVTE